MSDEKNIEDDENRRLQASFRKAWPNAYANAMREVGLIVDAIATQQEEVKAFRDDLKEKNVRITGLVNNVCDTAKESLGGSAGTLEKAVRKMEASYANVFSELQEQQSAFLSGLIAKQRSLDDDRRELHEARQNWSIKRANQVAEMEADKKALAAEVHKFWSLGFWGRVFVPKSLRELSKRYASAGS